MGDSDKSSIDYFNKHLKLMREMGQSTNYESIDSTKDFFTKLKGAYQYERETTI